MTPRPRVLITGAGAVCGAGRTPDAICDALLEGRSAVGPIQQWDASRWPVRVAAEVIGVDARTLVEDRKLHKLISRTDLFGLYAADEAICQSRLAESRQGLDAAAVAEFNDRSGIFAGSGGGAYRSNYDFFPLLTSAHGSLQAFGRELGASVNPMWLLRNLPNNVLCHVGIRHQLKGTNGCITNQCVGGITALAEAAAALRAGEADRMIAVGHDAPFEPETVLHYHGLGLLAPDTLRPFDQQRQGTVFGEGAGALVLETAESARLRQAPCLGEYLGAGCTTEATGILDVRPDGQGLARAMQRALADARVTPDQVGVIVAHGNGTPASDASEARAIHNVFGSNPPPITAFKWAYGHSIAASGMLDTTVALRVLQRQQVPAIATLNHPDASLPPLPFARQATAPRSPIALIACRGFGGMNVAVLLRATPVSPPL